MARKGGSTTAAVCVLLLCVLSCVASSDDAAWQTGVGSTARVPLYVRKARLYAQRREAYEQIMQVRMAALAQTSTQFATQLFFHRVTKSINSTRGPGNGTRAGLYGGNRPGHLGNVLLAPLSVYASLAMMMTASWGVTKREVIAALNMEGEGRGVHAALERALTSLREDDNDDINSNLDGRELEVEEEGRGEDAGLDMLSDQDLEDIIRNDFALDSKISYNTGHQQIRYSARVSTSTDPDPAPPPPPEPDMQIRLANAMFHSEEVGLSQRFSNRLVTLYGAPPMAMQGEEPQVSVNLWVDAVTRGAVPNMLQSGDVTEDALLVLVSAFSFRGAWENNFEERESIPLEFKTLKGESVATPGMYWQGNYSMKILNEMGGAKVLEAPYDNQRYSLFLVLPKSPRRLREVEQGFQTLNLPEVFREMPQPAMMSVMLPKFRLQVTESLDEVLQAMGVRRLFAEGRADLRRLTDETESVLFVKGFFQHAALEVDEGGKRERNVQIDPGDLHRDLDLEVVSEGGVKADVPPVAGVGDGGGGGDGGVVLGDHGVMADESKGAGSLDGDFYYSDDDEFYDDDFDDYEDEDEEDDYGLWEDSDDSNDYFFADRPFYFVVMDKQYGLILLMGRVTNPAP